MIVCPSCKWQQAEGKECQRCGIIFDRYRPPEERPIFQQEGELVEEEQAVGPSPLRRIYRVMRIVSPLVTILIVFLVFSLPTPPKVDRDADATARAQQKIASVQQAIANGSSAYDLHFTETELNSVLATTLRPSDAALAEMDVDQREAVESIRDLRIKLKDDNVHVYVAFKFYGKMLTLSLTGKVRVEDHQLRLDAESGRFGSLPLPSLVLERAMRRVFSAPENREKFRLPDHIKDVRVEGGQMVVIVDPNSTGKSSVTF